MSQFTPNSELVFSQKFTQPNADLAFGAESDATGIVATITLPSLIVSANANYIEQVTPIQANICLPSLGCEVQVAYDSNVWRGLWIKGENKSETANGLLATQYIYAEKSAPLQQHYHFYQETADLIQCKVATDSQLSDNIRSKSAFSHEVARYIDNRWRMGFENLIYLADTMQYHMEVARYLAIRNRGGFEPMIRLQFAMHVGMETATKLAFTFFNKAEIAWYIADGYRIGFEVARLIPYPTRQKETEQKNNGQYQPNADLNFTCKWVAPNADLVFYLSGQGKCQPQNKLLIQYDEVIFVSNDISLTNLDTGKGIAIFSGNIGIDNKAYCWSLSAEIAYFETIKKGTLVELAIGGEIWRFIIDEISEGRQFGDKTITISGKSQAVLLSYPFTDLRGYKYSQNTSAVQIAQAEIDRVGGFSLDWRLISENGWLIPANAYSYTQYTPIQAIQDIANAGGGFVNAHSSEKKLIIKSDYPVASWEWMSLKPDIVIPESLIWSKGDTYSEKPNYNGVWVSSDKDNGVQGFIRRKGTDGSITPDQVIHSAITEQSVAIHRGICELSQAGITQAIALNTPLHSDIGILTPSDFVTVKVAGVAQNAIVRGVNITFSMSNDGKIDVQNQLKLEAKL